jgi:hypothetical protein
MNVIRSRSATYLSVGFVLLLALLVASSASGATWQTCKPGGTGFGDAHCTTTGTAFGQEAVTPSVGTATTWTNTKTASGTTASTPMKLRGVTAAVEVEVECTGATGSGKVENTSGTTATASTTIEYTGCTVPKPSGCKVVGGKITTEPLTATTLGQPAGTVKITPTAGTKIATLSLETCVPNVLNHSFPLTGSYSATVTGATWTTTHAEVTSQAALLLGGTKWGIAEALTPSMTSGNPISLN